MKKIYGLLSVLCVLTACASEPNMDDWSAEQIYNKAFDDLEATKYKKAAEEFEKVETEHPYSKWAVKSKLMSAFAYYKDEKYDDAIIATDRFLKYHPGNKDAAYALYLKGICYYDQISAAEKDQGDTQKAEEAFQYLIALFPNTPYAEDARKKINLTEDYKAGQEMIIGRFYLNDGNYLSALNRFNVVLENYQTTIQIEEALYREVEIYAIFGMNQYANGYYKILQQNYPNSKWTEKAAKIMERIGVENKTSSSSSNIAPAVSGANEKSEENSSWFSGWFGDNDEPEAKTAVAETESEESSSWFSGWFGKKEKVADEPRESWYSRWKAQKKDEENATQAAAVETEKTEPEKSSSWFSGWFGGNDEPEAKTAAVETEKTEPEKSSSWFSGWFGGNDEPEAKTAAVETEKTEPEKSSSWFSGWFGGNDEPEVAVETPIETTDLAPENDFSYSGADDENRVVLASKEESKSWFGWFDGDNSGK